jgi:hypothetical protein
VNQQVWKQHIHPSHCLENAQAKIPFMIVNNGRDEAHFHSGVKKTDYVATNLAINIRPL